MTDTNTRKADHPIDPIFLKRWSARSFQGEPMPEADLMAMFEAARWAQSSGNGQPWRFIYTLRTEPDWQRYVDLLVEGNAAWAQNASALVICLSKLRNHQADGSAPKPIRTHSLDLGAAMQSFSLQAAAMGYVAHAMAGIHADEISAELGISETDYVVQAVIAVGRPAPKEMLSERFRGREVPSLRKPMTEIVFKGSFNP